MINDLGFKLQLRSSLHYNLLRMWKSQI